MREIKFRAWDKEANKMTLPQNKFISFSGVVWENRRGGAEDADDLVSTKRLVVMQAVGKKDCNCKDAFEGDIYTCGYKYEDGTHKYGDRNIIKDIRDFSPQDKFEIVGNIYENPELLKGGE